MSKHHALLALLGTLVFHRGWVALLYGADLQRLVGLNGRWLTFQFLRPDALGDQLLPSLFYLQQTPPLPNLLLGLGIKLFGWPLGAAWFCVGLSALLSLASAALMFLLLQALNGRIVPSAVAVGVLFLSSDILVMEYNSFGQTFYELLAQALVLAAILSFVRAIQTGSLRATLCLGISVGLLALTRSSFALFFVVPLLGLLLSGREGVRRHVVAYAAAVGLLQGGWAVKNGLLYDTFTLSASSWAGGSFMAGLKKSGHADHFKRDLLADRLRYPEWFVRMIEEQGLVDWHPPAFLAYAPSEITDRQQAIDERLHGTNQSENTIAQRVVFDHYLDAYRRFARRHPDVIAEKFVRSYELFWQPIRNYSHQFLSLLCVEPRVETFADLATVVPGLVSGALPEPRCRMEGKYGHRQIVPAEYPALERLPLVVHVVNFALLHTLTPLLAVAGLLAVIRRREVASWLPFVVMFGVFVYGAVVFNLAEFTENMRFRLSIEPVIWVLSLETVRRTAAWLDRRRALRTRSAA